MCRQTPERVACWDECTPPASWASGPTRQVQLDRHPAQREPPCTPSFIRHRTQERRSGLSVHGPYSFRCRSLQDIPRSRTLVSTAHACVCQWTPLHMLEEFRPMCFHVEKWGQERNFLSIVHVVPLSVLFKRTPLGPWLGRSVG